MTTTTFRNLTSLQDAMDLCRQHLRGRRTTSELVSLTEALGRVLANPVRADSPLPHFPRSTMDGYAVRAADTFSASPALPVMVQLVGTVRVGQAPDFTIRAGQTAEIPTGGMLPEGADAVVMLEYTEQGGEDTIQASRPVAPGQHVQQIGEDIPEQAEALPTGAALTSAHIALIAALGTTEVEVQRQPRVGLISTGDEIVPPEAQPAPGQTRDANVHGLAALCQRSGAEPVMLGIVRDQPKVLRQLVQDSLPEVDLLAISGGSSAGARDMTREVLASLGPPGVFVDGVAIRPGKPTIIAAHADKLAFGLPGHPVSALVVFDRLVRPVLTWLMGNSRREYPRPARVTRNIPSQPGFTEYVRVRLYRDDEQWKAEPLFGKSATVSSLAYADGLIEIPAGVEGLKQGELTDVILWD